MKRLFVTALALFIINVPCFAQDDGGFRGLKWGEPLPENGFTFIRKDPTYGGIDDYARNGEDLEIGAGKATDIRYGFWNNKFFSVMIHFEGSVNFHGIFNAAKEKYGEPFRPNRFKEEYGWPRLPNTSMMIEYSEITRKGYLYMVSKELSKEARERDKAKAKEGARKGF